MEPMQRMMVIRLLEKISLDKDTAKRLQIANVSRYRIKGEQDDNFVKPEG